MTATAPRGPRPARRSLACLALPMALLAGCSSSDTAASTDQESAQEEASPSPEPTEVAAAAPRLAITHDGGVQVLDASTFETVGEFSMEGFNRVNPAGDGRHVVVSAAGGFDVLDAGTWGEPHGDHAHHYAADPVMTGVTYEAREPGHVVAHEGRTALFDDDTGGITVLDAGEIADPDAADAARELTTPSAHHGVAVELTDGTLVVSEGTEDERTGVRVLDGQGEEVTGSDRCPGVHGEAVAAEETVVIGCEDGALVYAGGELTKVPSPDAYGRIGNQAGTEVSPIVLGDYKTDPDAERERPTRVSLIDTRTAELRLVDLPASYSFRSLGRGEDGEALVLGTDGQLHVIDPDSGELVRSTPVVDAWEEPTEWQQPRPTLQVHGGTAYVTEPASDTVHAVDVATGEVWKSGDLSVTPNELTVVSGDVEHGAEHDHGDGDDDHDDHADEG